ncbi:hypothetical protein JW921_03435 [Candidatus Fermentibacterales bacterium]|nr:hypothetical protein [Candidatus Fermentibacterales bacterium]
MRLLCICSLLLISAVATGASVVRTLDAPDTNISGLAFGDGKLWAVDGGTSMIYGLDPVSGSVETSFYATHSSVPSYSPGGLAFYNNNLFASFFYSTSSTYIYWYTTAGANAGYDILC